MRERKDEANEMLSDSPSWAYLSRRWRYTSNLIFRIASTKHWMNACCSILLHHALAQENDENALVAIRKSRLGRDCIYSHSYSDSCGAMCHMLIIRMTWRKNDHRHNSVNSGNDTSHLHEHISSFNSTFFLASLIHRVIHSHYKRWVNNTIHLSREKWFWIERMILLGWMPPQADDYGRWRETFK